MMKLDRMMIAAPKSGSGKTTLTCALLQTLKDAGKNVVSYKCGPDYIDPMYHQKVLDIPSKNSDTFFTGEEETKWLFLKNRTEKDFAVIEGVMGLYDGLGGIREEGSSYHLAKVTKTPIILVVDAKGMGRSVLPLIKGFMDYDKEQLIKGVILNRMSGAYYKTMKPLIEKDLSVCVVGYFPENKKLHIESRHLGLVMPDELDDIKVQLQTASVELKKTISIEQIMQIAAGAEDLECSEFDIDAADSFKGEVSPVIAVARDEAFCFYYEDNLMLLQDYGAEIVYFSPLHDKEIPENCHGILLGGGYPELYMEKLSQNESMKASIRKAIYHHMPIVAECGGFMYLHKEMTDDKGRTYEMVGAIDGNGIYTGKLVRFGYVELREKCANFLPEDTCIRGHEFHYFDSSRNGEDVVARKPVTGRTYDCVIEMENSWLGFPHLYYPSNPQFAKNYVKKAKDYMRKFL
ncbi:MAG: cobyrinate a,c-diamide synthase [Frisingicoccus sp.]|nr:cobyrinate a,c-diamide synthase [Frisingicoccus sp.]